MNAPTDPAKKATTLKQLKAKITRLHSHQQQRILLDNGDSDGLTGEEVSLHHHITKMKENTNDNPDTEWGGNQPNYINSHTAHIYGPPEKKI